MVQRAETLATKPEFDLRFQLVGGENGLLNPHKSYGAHTRTVTHTHARVRAGSHTHTHICK